MDCFKPRMLAARTTVHTECVNWYTHLTHASVPAAMKMITHTHTHTLIILISTIAPVEIIFYIIILHIRSKSDAANALSMVTFSLRSIVLVNAAACMSDGLFQRLPEVVGKLKMTGIFKWNLLGLSGQEECLRLHKTEINSGRKWVENNYVTCLVLFIVINPPIERAHSYGSRAEIGNGDPSLSQCHPESRRQAMRKPRRESKLEDDSPKSSLPLLHLILTLIKY